MLPLLANTKFANYHTALLVALNFSYARLPQMGEGEETTDDNKSWRENHTVFGILTWDISGSKLLWSWRRLRR